MWMNLYNFTHSSLGEKKFDEERTERLETMQKGVAGTP